MKLKLFSAILFAVGALGARAQAQATTQPPASTPPPAPPPPPISTPGSASGPPPISVPSPEATAPAASTNASDQIVDLVAFDAVPLPDAVRTLALQAGLNIEFDPKLLNGTGPQGQPIPVPTVTEKWHNVTAMQALTALLDNWDWQLQWDTRSKIGRITAKNPNELEPLLETVIQLKYSSPSNIAAEITPTLSSRSRIIRDDRTHQLILMTTEKELPAVEALIGKLDTATREVLIEARIIETTKDITSAKGIDWTGTLAAQHVSFGNGLTSGTVTSQNGSGTPSAITTTTPGGGTVSSTPSGLINSVSNLTSLTTVIPGNPASGGGFSLDTVHGISPSTAFLSADGVSAVLSFLNSDADTKSIAFPRTVALDGVPTTLMVVQNVPVFQQDQSAPSNGSAQGLATVKPVYDLKVNDTILNEVGVKLQVTPRIAGPTNVLMEVQPEISQKDALVASETLNGQVSTAPIFDRRRIVTQASVPSGFTLVLGGLDSDNVTKNYTKVPFLGDLPGLGYAFRSDSKTHVRDSILVFITPTIVQDSDFQPSDSMFLKSRGVGMTPLNESPWDKGEPKDWSKPKAPFTQTYQP